MKNQELTEPLKIFNYVLNSNKHGDAKNLSEFCQVFAEKLIQMNIRYELVHAEMILRSFIRRKSNILEFPDFTAAGMLDDYQIVKLNDAQEHNPSVLMGLSYGYLKKQLLSPDLYEKCATGPFDSLAVDDLSRYL